MPIVPPPGIVVTSDGTIKSYGMTREEWLTILKGQGWRCPICGRVPKSGRFVIDHEHVKGWKKMKREQRRLYVRGIVCFLCNGKCLSKWTTVERARAVVKYFSAYLRTRPKNRV